MKLLSHVWLFAIPWTVVTRLICPWNFQARALEWVAMSFSRGSSQPGDQTRVSHIAGRRFTLWATREARCMDMPHWLPSMGSHRVRHHWSDLAAAAATFYLCISWWTFGSFPYLDCYRQFHKFLYGYTSIQYISDLHLKIKTTCLYISRMLLCSVTLYLWETLIYGKASWSPWSDIWQQLKQLYPCTCKTKAM